MLDRKAMLAGMHLLGKAFNRPIAPDVIAVYHTVIGDRLDARQWQQAVKRALEAESFFPPPAVLLRYGLADGMPEARAVETYNRILEDFEDRKAKGPREVREAYGEAAMEAFLAAGGSRVFSWCEPRDEPFRRKAFITAWREATDQLPARALPPGNIGQLDRAELQEDDDGEAKG